MLSLESRSAQPPTSQPSYDEGGSREIANAERATTREISPVLMEETSAMDTGRVLALAGHREHPGYSSSSGTVHFPCSPHLRTAHYEKN